MNLSVCSFEHKVAASSLASGVLLAMRQYLLEHEDNDDMVRPFELLPKPIAK